VNKYRVRLTYEFEVSTGGNACKAIELARYRIAHDPAFKDPSMIKATSTAVEYKDDEDEDELTD